MADTRQVVSWALERKCIFRSGDEWFLPKQTYMQLADLRTVAEAFPDRRVVDGICVTGWTTGRDHAGRCHDIPCSGFRIEDRLGKFGGLPAAVNTCAKCEANAKNKTGITVAGCYGALDVWPNSQELDEQLWKIVQEHNLETRLRAAFPVTRPLWYGFWIESPLRRLQAELLYDLLDVACDHDDPQDKDIGISSMPSRSPLLGSCLSMSRWLHSATPTSAGTPSSRIALGAKQTPRWDAGRKNTRRSQTIAGSAGTLSTRTTITAASGTTTIGMPRPWKRTWVSRPMKRSRSVSCCIVVARSSRPKRSSTTRAMAPCCVRSPGSASSVG